MELRLILALCLVLGSALCGKALADGARRRARTLTALEEGTRRLKIHMTSLLEPVRDALERSDCPLYALVGEAMEGGLSAGEGWLRAQRRASRRGGPIDALDEGDRQLLDRLFARLGQSGREEQEALLDAALRGLEERRDEAAGKARQAERLYLTLGLLTGIMLALVVL